MSNKITFRPIFKKDYPQIEDIIRKTWNYDQFCSPKTAKQLAKIFLLSVLANQTYTQVALIDDKCVGVIMAKNIKEHHCPFIFHFNQFISIFKLLISKEGRDVTNIFSDVNDIDRQLLQASHKEYQGELAFFAIDESYRGIGLGRKLFLQALDYMKEANIDEFYLYTDTSCNYHFYEHLGMIRRVEKKHSFSIEQTSAAMTFYLYDYSS